MLKPKTGPDMKRLFSAVVVAYLVTQVCASAALAGNTRHFSDSIHINRDSSLDVVETIVQDSNGEFMSGLLRAIPLEYSVPGGRTLHTQVIVDGVTDDRNLPVGYTASNDGKIVTIRLGDAREPASGVQTYRIHYTVRNAVSFVDGHPQLYWTVVGADWPFSVDQALAELYLPPAIALQKTDVESYFGPPGSQQKAEIFAAQDGAGFRASNLKPGESLSFIVRLPAGSVAKPSFFQRWLWHVSDWWPMYFLPVATGILLFLLWWQGGRDEDGGQPIVAGWTPPTGLRPAEVGTVVDERCDMDDIVSTLLDLAIRGYFKIREVSTPGESWASAKDYEFIVNERPAKDELAGYEQTFMRCLFSGRAAGSSVKLSKLPSEFALMLSTIRATVYQALMGKGMFRQNPQTVRLAYYGYTFGLSIGAFICFAMSNWPFGFGLAYSALFVGLMANAMPAKTIAGSRAARECLGFAQFVHTAPIAEIRGLAHEDLSTFSRLLPYAIVLKAGDRWAEAFEGLLEQPPEWYVWDDSSGSRPDFDARSFVHDVGGMLRSVEMALSSIEQSAAMPTAADTTGTAAGFGGAGGGGW